MARLCELISPLGDKLRFARMTVSEGLSRLFDIQLEAVSEQADIAPRQLIGKSLTVRVTYEDGAVRHFNGYVTRMSISASRGRYHSYRLELRPWLWFLTRTSDCRIFQEESVPDILAKVFEDHSTKSVVERYTDRGRYAKWEYCVQYRETDFNFVSRLMEQEGIYYFFEHAEGAHKLVITDAKGRHAEIAGPADIPYLPESPDQTRTRDYVDGWQARMGVEPGVYVIDDYDFKRPAVSLQVTRKAEQQADFSPPYELYDWPGDYDSVDEGETYAAARVEEAHGHSVVHQGGGRLRHFSSGLRFKLKDHPIAGENDEYLITDTQYEFVDNDFESGDGRQTGFACAFGALRARQQYRPPRTAARPIIQGIQTAVVTGPQGEEIHTDKFGRIKVQFRWDRYGKNDETSSCWMRVAFLSAGGRFGLVSIPRIGHEVVVSFLEGDPDRPLVTGVVYNGANLPPWELPANKTQSGILTRSTKGAGYDNANAIRFEDKTGAEQLWIHAEKNQDIEVENDETHWVGHDRSKTVDHDETVLVKHDRTETVGNNETITIGVNRTESVGANETVTIGANRSHSVGSSETLTVALQRTHTVGANETITVGAAQELTVGGARVVTVGAAQAVTIGGNQSTSIGGNETLSVGGKQTVSIGSDQAASIGGQRSTSVAKADSLSVGEDSTLQVGGARSADVGKDDVLKIAKKWIVEAGDSIVFKTGDASISMKKDGSIVIKGKDIAIEGSGKINVKASGDVVLKGSKVTQN